jgi:sec-independent protein translocase protein TatA
MALGTLEMAFLAVIAIFLFGANKIPQLARSVGLAKGEYQKALNEVSENTAMQDMDRGGMTESMSSEQE